MEFMDFVNPNSLADINLSFTQSLYGIFLAILSSAILRKLYIIYGRSMNNRVYFGNIFILLTITTCIVITIVKYSLALSLGLVGALSIVRFRAAIKEPEELVFLFLCIAFGIAFGSNQFLIGILLLIAASLVIIITNLFFQKNSGLDHSGSLIIISGDRQEIQAVSKTDIKKLLSPGGWAILKEIEMCEGMSRIVLKVANAEGSNDQIEKLSTLCNDKKLNFNFISDINVPS